MTIITHKTTACGHTSTASIFTQEMEFQFHHEVVFVDKVCLDCDHSIMIGKVSLVNVPKIFIMETDKPRNVFVGSKRLSDVIDLSSCVLFCGIREEEDGCRFINLWRDIKEFPVWRLPYAVKNSFDKDSPPEEDIPSNFLFSSVCGNMLWNNVETFIDFLSRESVQWDSDGLFA